jgi:hypothetical protein
MHRGGMALVCSTEDHISSVSHDKDVVHQEGMDHSQKMVPHEGQDIEIPLSRIHGHR